MTQKTGSLKYPREEFNEDEEEEEEERDEEGDEGSDKEGSDEEGSDEKREEEDDDEEGDEEDDDEEGDAKVAEDSDDESESHIPTNVDEDAYWASWTPEHDFVMQLVDNDVVKRNRAIKKLRKYFVVRSKSADNPFSEPDMLKIWKGLHYTMWHSDKLLVQQELAGTLSLLITAFTTLDSAVLFIKCFFHTIVREWDGIDAHRQNKFLTLVRRMWRQSLVLLQQHHWKQDVVDDLLDLLRQTLIQPNSSMATGLTFHMIDIYVDELTKVGGKSLGQDQVIVFLRPFVVFSLKEKNQQLVRAVEKDVFAALVEQVEEDFLEDLNEEGYEKHGKINNEKQGGPIDNGIGLENKGSRLNVDFGRVGGYILKLAGGKKVPSLNRKVLYAIAAKYENLANGVYPWEEIEMEGREGRKEDGGMKKQEIAQAVKRLQKDNERIERESGKKWKKSKGDRVEGEVGEKEEEEEEEDGDGEAEPINEDDQVEFEEVKPKKPKKKMKKGEESAKIKDKDSAVCKPLKKERKRKNNEKPKRKQGKGVVQSRSGAWTVKE